MIVGFSQDASLALAYWTIEGRAPSLGDPLDNPATAFPHAGQPFTIVDLEDMLKVAQFPGGLSVIAQSRAASFDGFLKHGADRLRNGDCRPRRGTARIRQNARRPRRRQTRAEKRLAHVDVAQTCNALLVEQSGF